MSRLAVGVAIAILGSSCVASSIPRDPISRETEIRQSRPRLEAERFDPQEHDPALASAFLAADLKAERAVGNVPRDGGFIFRFWQVKKQILHEAFDIDWQSPADLNPGIVYDSYGQPQLTETERATIVSLVRGRTEGTDEEVVGAWRTFEGVVFVATRGGASGDLRHYELHGCEQTWTIVAVHDVCEVPVR
jgi:hypothetical protein